MHTEQETNVHKDVRALSDDELDIVRILEEKVEFIQNRITYD